MEDDEKAHGYAEIDTRCTVADDRAALRMQGLQQLTERSVQHNQFSDASLEVTGDHRVDEVLCAFALLCIRHLPL